MANTSSYTVPGGSHDPSTTPRPPSVGPATFLPHRRLEDNSRKTCELVTLPRRGQSGPGASPPPSRDRVAVHAPGRSVQRDRKSTRLNSSHVRISYAVFCLRKQQPIS